jgi:thermostable 8-oxoguanine DNA glycosylase
VDLQKSELQAKLIYALIVAGKSAKFADEKTRALMEYRHSDELPFDMLLRLRMEMKLWDALKAVRTGNYRKMERALQYLSESDLELTTCTPQQLEFIPGVGPKTSRFFILWTRPDAECAALDVHILRWLRTLGYLAPFSTPQDGETYGWWERVFLKEAQERGMKPSKLDAQVWEAGAKRTMPQQIVTVV